MSIAEFDVDFEIGIGIDGNIGEEACDHDDPLRLTEEQRALAGRPEYIQMALKIAYPWASMFRHLGDDIESAALVGLCQAARLFDPGMGLMFSTIAVRRIRGAVADFLRREVPHGFRYTPSFRKDMPKVLPLSLCFESEKGVGSDSIAVSLIDLLPSDDLPVGWEIESEDEVLAILGNLPAGRAYEGLRWFYLRADCQTLRRAGEAAGLTESRMSQARGEAVRLLREMLGIEIEDNDQSTQEPAAQDRAGDDD